MFFEHNGTKLETNKRWQEISKHLEMKQYTSK